MLSVLAKYCEKKHKNKNSINENVSVVEKIIEDLTLVLMFY